MELKYSENVNVNYRVSQWICINQNSNSFSPIRKGVNGLGLVQTRTTIGNRGLVLGLGLKMVDLKPDQIHD